MSIFASQSHDLIPIPFDPPHVVTIRKLSGLQLTTLQRTDGTPIDTHAVLRMGIVSWTYPDPVTPETIADLTREALELLALAIMKLTMPSLFQTPEERETETKNG